MLPSPAPEITAYVGELFRYAIEEWPEAENFGQATFAGPVEYRRIGQEIKAMGLTGPYVLCAADSLYIRGDCRLRGVIIVAGKVRIGTGFKGAVQVFARDAIGLEERVVLQAGSGLWVNGGTRWRSVRLGENCRVDGCCGEGEYGTAAISIRALPSTVFCRSEGIGVCRRNCRCAGSCRGKSVCRRTLSFCFRRILC